MTDISGKYLLEHPVLAIHLQELLKANPPQSYADRVIIINKIKKFHKFINQGYLCDIIPGSPGHKHSLLDSDSDDSITNINQKLVTDLEQSLKLGDWPEHLANYNKPNNSINTRSKS
jgi:hypothetical protein